MGHLAEAVPWVAALVASLGFSKILFEGWSDFMDCLRSWLRSVAKNFVFGDRIQSHAELRDSADHLKLALVAVVGVIAGLISRALLVGAGLI